MKDDSLENPLKSKGMHLWCGKQAVDGVTR